MIVQDARLVIVTLEAAEPVVEALESLPPGAVVEGGLALTHVALHDGRAFERAEALSFRARVGEGVEARAALLVDGAIVTGEVTFARCERRTQLRATVPGAKPAALETAPSPAAARAPAASQPARDAGPPATPSSVPPPATPTPTEDAGDVGWGDLASLSAEQTKDDLAAKALEELAKEEARKKAEAERAGATPGFLSERRREKKLSRKKAALKATVPLFEKQPLPKSRRKRGAPPEAVDLDVPYPEPGDLLQHRQFGLCEVLRIDDEGAVRVLLRKNGKKKQLHLDVFEVSAPRENDQGKRVFTLRPRRK